MTRQLVASGICARCHRRRPVWATVDVRPLVEPGYLYLECDTSRGPLCDPCETLDRLADPAYRRLCWPAAERWEREAVAAGGVRPEATEAT